MELSARHSSQPRKLLAQVRVSARRFEDRCGAIMARTIQRESTIELATTRRSVVMTKGLAEPIESLCFSVAFHPNTEIAAADETSAKSLGVLLV